jgi:hypothetical protein
MRALLHQHFDGSVWLYQAEIRAKVIDENGTELVKSCVELRVYSLFAYIDITHTYIYVYTHTYKDTKTYLSSNKSIPASPSGICGEQSGTVTSVLLVLRVYTVRVTQQIFNSYCCSAALI